MADLVRCGRCGTTGERVDRVVRSGSEPIRDLCVGGRVHGPWLSQGSAAALVLEVTERVVAEAAARDRDRGELTVKAAMTLDLEELDWRHAGLKETTIRYLFRESATRYYQRLSWILARPEATTYAPQLVARLERLRDARSARSARRHGFAIA